VAKSLEKVFPLTNMLDKYFNVNQSKNGGIVKRSIKQILSFPTDLEVRKQVVRWCVCVRIRTPNH